MSEELSCASCFYLFHNEVEGKPECRRYPPSAQAVISGEIGVNSFDDDNDIKPISLEMVNSFPTVKDGMWCGEWKCKPETKGALL